MRFTMAAGFGMSATCNLSARFPMILFLFTPALVIRHMMAVSYKTPDRTPSFLTQLFEQAVHPVHVRFA